ncbi:hypothetical protein PQ478_09215 [Alkalihalophilus pseudofirmus]|uniref:hypothetical protein n=1 Tax=Alkalihalophilus pseudofirmus TaxID=79885 RepID=UPI00259AF5AF|nr:hypothetical protein [Alkalihalophilus pseudofirmus]WEG18648.1 hypothetical protein PQ478_09215 [Alkalihalophilus pseudofirmus]
MTVILLTVAIYNVVTGKLFKSFIVQAGEYQIKEFRKEEIKDEETIKLVIKLVFVLLATLSLLTLTIVYLCFALSYDPFVYPSLAMLSLYILNIIVSLIRSKKLKGAPKSEDDVRKLQSKIYRKRTFKSTVIGVVGLAYYLYMFAALVFLV